MRSSVQAGVRVHCFDKESMIECHHDAAGSANWESTAPAVPSRGGPRAAAAFQAAGLAVAGQPCHPGQAAGGCKLTRGWCHSQGWRYDAVALPDCVVKRGCLKVSITLLEHAYHQAVDLLTMGLSYSDLSILPLTSLHQQLFQCLQVYHFID